MKINPFRLVFQIFLILTFLAGIYVLVLIDKRKTLETIINQTDSEIIQNDPNQVEIQENVVVANNTNSNCPNLLIHKGNQYFLYNTNSPADNNSNPIIFNNINEYGEYLENQYNNGINCPALFVQEETDAQGNDVYRVRTSPFNLEAGTQITTSSVNSDNLYPGFDAYGLDNGKYTNLDKLHDETGNSEEISDNPMDPNWGGVEYTQEQIDSGKYDENNITRPLLFQPKLSFNADAPSLFPQPQDIL